MLDDDNAASIAAVLERITNRVTFYQAMLPAKANLIEGGGDGSAIARPGFCSQP
jgi:hypothetical protein